MSIVDTVKEKLLGPKKYEPGMGNALWREVVIAPLKAARDYMKAAKAVPKSPEQVGLERRRAAKRNAKRAVQKTSRRKNRG